MGFAYANEASELFSGGCILLSFSSNGEGFIDKFILSACQIYPLIYPQNAESTTGWWGVVRTGVGKTLWAMLQSSPQTLL